MGDPRLRADARPGRTRRERFAVRLPTGGLRPSVVVVAGLLLLLAGCASTPDVEPPLETPRVSFADLATELGLTRAYDTRLRRVVLSEAGGDRITALAGTTIVTVRGVPFETLRPIGDVDDSLWLDEQDARTIRGMWRGGVTVAVPYPPPPVLVGPASDTAALPPPPVLPGPPVVPSSYAVGASPAEGRAWGVPLRREWDYIVIHHSASSSGNAARFDAEHRERGWDGLGYDFVIGNGRGSGDGQVEIGWRWPQQREGAHAGNETMNQHGIGICLVGDFTKTRPTSAQLASLQRLCNFLSAYCGIPPPNIRYHRDVRDKERGGTLCPGKYFPTSFRFHPQPGVRRGIMFGPGTR